MLFFYAQKYKFILVILLGYAIGLSFFLTGFTELIIQLENNYPDRGWKPVRNGELQLIFVIK